jgi:hypothetical protein
MLSRKYDFLEYWRREGRIFLRGVKDIQLVFWTIKTCDILKVKNALVTGVHYVTQNIILFLVVYYVFGAQLIFILFVT